MTHTDPRVVWGLPAHLGASPPAPARHHRDGPEGRASRRQPRHVPVPEQLSPQLQRTGSIAPADWAGETIDGEYLIEARIGGGSFSDCYRGIERRSGAPVCFKIEDPAKIKGHSRLETEYATLRSMAIGWQGLRRRYSPEPLHFARKHGCSLLVQELLGPSLGDLQRMCHGKFSAHTVAMLACEIVDCIEFVHSQGYVHRDVKTQNFLVGRGADADHCFVCDFGLSRPFCKDRTQPRTGGRPAGTIRYVSLNAHRGYEQTRRDDLESVGYMLIHLLHGKLPWQGIQESDKRKRHLLIFEKKESTSIEQLCRKCPPAFEAYVRYTRSLAFDEVPDYRYCRKLFAQLASECGGLRRYDLYDWRVRGVYNGGGGAPSPSPWRHPQGQRRGHSMEEYSEEYTDEDADGPLSPQTPEAPGPMLRQSSPPRRPHQQGSGAMRTPPAPARDLHLSCQAAAEAPAHGAGTARAQRFEPGEVVDANFGGGWFAATVHSRDDDGSYVVRWVDDGTFTAMMYPEQLRRRRPAGSAPAAPPPIPTREPRHARSPPGRRRHRAHSPPGQMHSSTRQPLQQPQQQQQRQGYASSAYFGSSRTRSDYAAPGGGAGAPPGPCGGSARAPRGGGGPRWQPGDSVVVTGRDRQALPAWVVYYHEPGATYTVRWGDGSHSTGIPESRIRGGIML